MCIRDSRLPVAAAVRLYAGRMVGVNADGNAVPAGNAAAIALSLIHIYPDPEVARERRAAAWDNFEYFARTYFPHYISKANSLLHDYLYKRLPAMVATPESQSDVIAAPRGEAKSTITSQIFVIWCVITERKWYPVIVMDAFEQSAVMLEAIKACLLYTSRCV